MAEDDFAEMLASLCARELPHARRDAQRSAEMIERLTSSLALTIAVTGQGDTQMISLLLEGVSNHLFAETAEKADVGSLLARRR